MELLDVGCESQCTVIPQRSKVGHTLSSRPERSGGEPASERSRIGNWLCVGWQSCHASQLWPVAPFIARLRWVGSKVARPSHNPSPLLLHRHFFCISQPPKTVISTGAGRAFANSAVEKSASSISDISRPRCRRHQSGHCVSVTWTTRDSGSWAIVIERETWLPAFHSE